MSTATKISTSEIGADMATVAIKSIEETWRKAEINPVPRAWFDLPAAADYLAVKPRTIREAVWAHELRRARLGKRFVFSKDDLDTWARSRLEFETG